MALISAFEATGLRPVSASCPWLVAGCRDRCRAVQDCRRVQIEEPGEVLQRLVERCHEMLRVVRVEVRRPMRV
jgi:hypothetical protein